MLFYEEVAPALPLRDYIECYWILLSDLSLSEELCLPDGSASLIFNFGSAYKRAICHFPDKKERVGRISLSHQGKQSILITQENPIRLLGLRFTPYGMAPFLGMDMTRYHPPFLETGEALNGMLGPLANEMWNTSTFNKKVILLESTLLKRLTEASPVDEIVKKAVGSMVRNAGTLRISHLLEELCVSKSSLEKKFQEYVGLSPKDLCNILRFNSIIYNGQKDPAPSLTELSYNLGFFDQSHLVRNFRSFTGLPPGRFFRQDNHLVEMLRQSYAARTTDIY